MNALPIRPPASPRPAFDVGIRTQGMVTLFEGATPRGRAYLPALRSARVRELERWGDGWAVASEDAPVALSALQRVNLKIGRLP